jgi:hypothetical protein
VDVTTLLVWDWGRERKQKVEVRMVILESEWGKVGSQGIRLEAEWSLI